MHFEGLGGMQVGGVGAGVLMGATAVLASLWLWSWRGWRRSVRELEQALDLAGQGRAFRARRRRLNRPLRRVADSIRGLVNGEVERRGRAEREVEQLRVVLGGMSEGVVAIDPRRRLLFANGSADRLFGLGPQAVGRLVLELIRSPQVQEAVDATLDGPGAFRGEFTVASRENPTRSVPRVLAFQGSVLPGETPSGAVLVFHDVTDLRRLERMRQDFVANASHELKTPLAAIKAFTETLLDSALHDEEVNVRFLHRIEEQADRLNQLILDLLSLARLESGQDVFQHEPLAVAQALGACVATHRERAEAHALDLSLDLGPVDEATRVVADEEAFRQVCDNLIDNAIKYTPEGGRVAVRCGLDAGWVEILVADSGIGIPRNDLPRIFERFYRVDKARSRELGGTGLGLAIVKHVVGSLGGQVAVDSRLGEGTQFRVRLPLLLPR